MNQDQNKQPSSQQPAEGSNDVPPPEQGSPQQGHENAPGEAAERLEKGEDGDPNPLAPPVNTQAGS